MSVTSGFFDSLNGDRKYNAEQLSSIFDGIITDGVLSGIGDVFATVPGDGLQVIVKSGKAWFNHTWTWNDGQLPIMLDLADVTLDRYDAIVLDINTDQSSRRNSITVVKGTPASSPSKPALTNTEKHHQYAIAYVRVNHGATEITASNVENMVGRSPCPFATGVLQSVDITDLWTQWNGQFDDWFSNVKEQLSGNVATNLQRQIDELRDNAHKILTGDDEPDSALGSDGDTYVKLL